VLILAQIKLAMKKYFVLIAFCTINYFANAQQLHTPAPSPTQVIKQDFSLSNIEISYSRPGMKGRKIFGDLVPYGQVWRTGANSATTITFGEDVSFGGQKVAAGKYGLLTIPGEKEWTIILSKQLDVTNASAYKQDQDVVRIQTKPVQIPATIENFMITFDEIKPTSLELELLWDKTLVSVPVTTDIDAKIMGDIDAAMKTDKPPYAQAAQYYLDNGKDLNQALEWFNKGIADSPEAYWLYYQKARTLAKLNKKQDAIDAANKSIELAKAAKNNDYVVLNEKLLNTLN
jgi:Protein of unknown function (DUF2911)